MSYYLLCLFVELNFLHFEVFIIFSNAFCLKVYFNDIITSHISFLWLIFAWCIFTIHLLLIFQFFCFLGLFYFII